MILQSPFPPDIRLEKEIQALNEKGFEVTLFCNQYDKTKLVSFPGCEIERVKALFDNQFLNKIFNFPVPFNPRFLFKLISTVKKVNSPIIHAHDLPMAIFGVIIKILFGKIIVFDMHENYPEALRAYKKKSLIERILKNHRIALIIEKWVLKLSDIIIVVTEENRDRLLEDGFSSSKIKIVSNTVDLNKFGKNDIPPDYFKEQYKNNFLITYTGRVSANRGLLTAVRAMNYLKNENNVNYKLLIVGEGNYLNILKSEVEENSLQNFVEFVSWPGHEKVHAYMQISNITIIPQPSNGHADTTVPHKLFEYMSQGKKILVSDSKPLKRIVEEIKCGEVFESNNPEDFANKVKVIKNSKIDYAQNGIIGVREKYNWKNDSKILIDIYDKLGRSK